MAGGVDVMVIVGRWTARGRPLLNACGSPGQTRRSCGSPAAPEGRRFPEGAAVPADSPEV